jgi:hypothetical protein
MRPIPASILEKLKKLRQTQAENADPKINLIMQRTKRYIEQGSLLQPFDLWTRPGLGPLDIAIRRENRLAGPDKLFLVYIEGGQAHVAWIDYLKSIEESNEWEYLYTLGPATDVAIEFDGRWERTSPDAEVCFDSPASWTLVTFGEPWFFRVTGGQLLVQQGQGAPTVLAESGVTRVQALRGWKNVYRWNHDHGLICAYIREGAVYYRNYANQGTEQNPLPPVWEQERLVDTLPTPAQNVALFRTNDYRVGFLCESNGEIHWAVTGRNWAGMAIEQHTITAGISLTVDLIPVTYVDICHEHTITAGIDLTVALLWGVAYNAFKWAENDGNTTILACAEHFLTDLTAADFQVYDEGNALFSVTAVDYSDDPCILILTVENLGFSTPGDLTVKFLGSGTTKGEAGQDVDPFEITFTPTGIEYEDVDPPQVEVIWNE